MKFCLGESRDSMGLCLLMTFLLCFDVAPSSAAVGTASYLGIDHVWLPSVKKVLQDKVGERALSPNQDLMLQCPPNGSFGGYETHWTLNGSLLDPVKDPKVTFTRGTGQITIKDVAQNRTRYEGVYQCGISNAFGTILGSMAQVKVKVLGSFGISPLTINVTLNQKLAIKCPERTYSQGLFYMWLNYTTRNKVNFPEPRVMTSQEDGTLYFSHVTNDDVVAAAYAKGIVCRISLALVEVGEKRYSKVVQLRRVGVNGSFEAAFQAKPSSTTVYLPVGGQRMFYCFPSGRSPVSLTWLKDSKLVVRSNQFLLFGHNRILRISNADSSVEGTYTFISQNYNGNISATGMTIRVVYPSTRKHYIQNKETFILDCMSRSFSYPAQWYYNGVNVDGLLNSVFQSRGFYHQNGSFTIKTAVPRDSGVYQCFVDGIAANQHYVYVIGAPLPPVKLNTTSCSGFTTQLSWKIKAEPNISVSSFIIEVGSTYEPDVYKQLKVLDDANARKEELRDLSPGANLTFRMKAVNNLGRGLPSRPSTLCITPSAKPTTFPEGLKAAPLVFSGGLGITWKPFPKIKWNGVHCVIRVYYKPNNIATWSLSRNNSICSVNTVQLHNLSSYELFDIKVQVQNEMGMGPNSSIVTAYSGQNAPQKPPSNLSVVSVTPYSITLQWDELRISGGSVDEYLVMYNGMPFGDHDQPPRPQRKRRSLDQGPNNHYRRSSIKSRRSLDQDPKDHLWRSSMRSRRSLDENPNNHLKRLFMRSKGSLDQDPNNYHRRSSMRSSRSLYENPNNHHKRLFMRSKRSLIQDPSNHRKSHVRSRRFLDQGHQGLLARISNRPLSVKDKRQILLAEVMNNFSGTKYKAKKILRRFRRDIVSRQKPQGTLRVKDRNVTIYRLAPYTKFQFTVQGVNSGGSGPQALIIQSTLNSVDSSYIFTIVVTSERFTPDYEDKESLKYKNLSDTLTIGLRRLFRNNFWVRSFALLKFRNGSVVSEFQVVAATPNRFSLLTSVLGMKDNYFPHLKIDTKQTNFAMEPNFTTPNISVSNPTPYPGVAITFECLTTDGPQFPVFSWFKEGKTIFPDIRHKVSSEDKKSVLTIRKLTPNEEGQYSCGVSKGNQKELSENIFINILPVITIVPRTSTKNEGEAANVSCKVLSGNITGMTLFIVKPDYNQQRLRQNLLIIPRLSIDSANQTAVVTFQCILVNSTGSTVSRSQLAVLTIVKPNYPKCLTEVKGEVTWSTTAVGKIDIQRCPGRATGHATRRCVKDQDSKPKWDYVNVGNCTTIVFQKLLLEAEAIVSDYKSSLNTSSLLQELERVTVASPKGLNGGDLDTTVRILSVLVNNSKVDNTTDDDQQNFIEICSNILEPTNTRPWIQFERQRRKNSDALWNRLVVTIDEYGLQLTSHITSGENKYLKAKNVVMRIDKVGLQSKVKDEGLAFKHEESSIFLPAEIFSGSTSNQRVVSLVYKTLNYVMQLENPVNKTHSGDSSVLIPSNTTMVTSTVRPQPTKKLKNAVKIKVQNKRMVEPVPPRTCVFWRQGLPSIWKTDGCNLVNSESNKHVTTCECDHLTIFAALMDPYGGPLPTKHQKALELISSIGCAISLFAILVTIVVMAFFWHELKGPRTIVLMNICVAIAIVCILVIAEGTARDTKAGCTVLAALLHFFLLAVFCWMLCEGALLYLIIVKVIGAKVEEKVKWFVVFGWGFPAFIVGISLGVTQTKGYGYFGNQTACWLEVDNGLIWAFVGPAIVILVINIVVLVLVIRQMMGTRHVQSKSRDVRVRMGVKAMMVLLPLLGLTWLFGLLSFSSATLAFKYLFAILNSLQGLMIFIFHCLFNKQVQDAVKRKYQKYSSTDSTGTGSRAKNQQRNKREPPGYSEGKVSQNEYEMSPEKRNSIVNLLSQSGTSVAAEKIGLAEIDAENQKVNPKLGTSSKPNQYSADEPSFSVISDGCENVSVVDHDYQLPFHSNIDDHRSIMTAENGANDAGLLNSAFKEDSCESANDIFQVQEDEQLGEQKFQFTSGDQRTLLDEVTNSLLQNLSSQIYIEVKPMTNEKYSSMGNGLGSPTQSLPNSKREFNPSANEKQYFDDDEKGKEKYNQLNSEDEEKEEAPPSTPSSFDFGPPLSVWSTDSQRSSPSIPKKDFEFDDKESDDDGTVVVSSSDSSDHETSVFSNSMNNNALRYFDAPERNSYDVSEISFGFDKYLAQLDDVEDDEPKKNGNLVFGSDSSDTSEDEFMEYDLVEVQEKTEENRHDEKVIFKGLKKID